MAARECEADRAGKRLTREERKAMRTEDFREATPVQRQAARERASKAIAHIESVRVTQTANGMTITDAMHAKNVASHVLTLECLDAIGE